MVDAAKASQFEGIRGILDPVPVHREWDFRHRLMEVQGKFDNTFFP
jgi:hypothetical protein